MKNEIEVLLEFEGCRSILNARPLDLLKKVESELGEFGVLAEKSRSVKVYTLVDNPKEPQHFLLQRWSKKYDEFINVKDITAIQENDKITVVPNIQLESTSKEKSSSTTGKNKFSKRNVAVNVVMLDILQSEVPKGAQRKELQKAGKIRKMYVTRYETTKEIKRKINSLFNAKDFTVLECICAGSRLTISCNQRLNGSDAIERRGCLYLCKSVEKEDGSDSDSDLPPLPAKRKQTMAVPSENADMNHYDRQLPPKRKRRRKAVPCGNEDAIVIPSGDEENILIDEAKEEEKQQQLQQTADGEDIAEWRKIREEQDREYEESLLADQEKETLDERRALVREQDQAYEDSLQIDQARAAEEVLKAKRQLKLQELQSSLIAKFQSMNALNTATRSVCFRLPNGDRIQQCFHENIATRELYEYILSTGHIDGSCFTLCQCFPRCEILPTDGRWDGSSEVITVEINDDSPDLLQIFEDNLKSDDESEKEMSMSEVLQNGEDERDKFMMAIRNGDQKTYLISRKDVYNDLITLYSKEAEVVLAYPLQIKFKDEKAIDAGGVSRDSFSAFFDKAYCHLFDGLYFLHPATHACVDMSSFTVFGAIMSHAYLTVGVLPDRLAFPCLAACLLGPTITIPDSILKECFITSLSVHEMKIVQNAASCTANRFLPEVESQLTSIFAIHGVRGIPKPDNFKRLLLQASTYTFLVKPAAALHKIAQGVPKSHIPFWQNMTVDRLYMLYKTILLSPSKVLSLLVEPNTKDDTEEKTWFYLRSYVGNMGNDELRRFFRFVTGSFVISVKSITVSFNRLDGSARRPIAHTCAPSLELASTYSSLPEFVSEFRTFLLDPQYSWEMDAI